MGLGQISQPATQGRDLTKLGIVVALNLEARCLGKNPKEVEGFLHLSGGTAAKISGVGSGGAQLAAELLAKKGARSLLSWGCAGGLHAGLSPGSLIIPKKVLSVDRASFSVDSVWHHRLCTRLGGYLDLHTGPLIQNPTALNTPTDKIASFKRTGAIAVDMESAAVAEVAKQKALPFLAIRAIVDPVSMTLPASALAAADEAGRVCPLQVLKGLFSNPGEFFSLVQLIRNFRSVKSSLMRVVRLAGHDFLAP